MTRRLSFLCLSFGVASATASGVAAAQSAPADASAPKPQAVTDAHAQVQQEPPDKGDHPAPNSVYAEGLGAGIIYSINYERMVLDQLGVRLGFSYLSVGSTATAGTSTASSSASYLMVPITASYTGLRTRHGAGLEAGAGTTLLYTSASSNALGTATSGAGITPLIVAMVGFRLHPVDHAGFNFRVGAMGLGGQGLGLSGADPSKFGFIPWAYLSLGASF
jgi:hypothetical protein